tara:strand:- start:332 stop:550 length:219 start_codon:yes stop_codon:yes gene_type:complete
MIELTYKTLDRCEWTETFNNLEEAATAAIYQLGSWDRFGGYIINEFGDCKLCNIVGTTMEKLEIKMIELRGK